MNQTILSRDTTLVVIPAQNEADTVAAIVQRVMAQGFDTLVVDDASTDITAEHARLAGAKVLSLPFHCGAWMAMQTGIRYALEKGYQGVVTLDADGQHDPRVIHKLLAPMEGPTAPNVVIGSCRSRGSLGRRIAWRFLRTLGGISVMDLTSGYRAYDHQALTAIASRSATLLEYQDVGVLLLLMEHGMAIREIRVPMSPRAVGKSRIFYSWFRVLYYMLSATLLCASKVRKYSRRPSPGSRGDDSSYQ